MARADEPLISEPVYLALSRPAMWLGIPIEASIPIAIAAVLVFLLTGNPLYGIVIALPALTVSRLIVRYDPNAFRLIFLGLRTKWRNVDRDWWGGSSYSPLPVEPLRRKGFAGD